MKRFTIVLFISCLYSIGLASQSFNWTEINEPYSGTIYSLAINSSDEIYAVFNNSIYHSTDMGMNWTEYPDNSIGPQVIYVNEEDAVFIGTSSSGLFYSFNNGQSWDWHYVHHAPHSGLSPYISAIWSDNNNILLNGYHSSSPFNFFYLYNGDPAGFYHFAERPGGLPAASDMYRVYLAANSSGTNWITPANNGLDSNFIYDLLVNSDDEIFVATESGIFFSDDQAENFSLLNNGIAAQQVNTICTDDEGTIYAGTEENGMYKSTDNGMSWEALTPMPDPQVLDIVVTSQGYIIASAGDMGIIFSDNGGASWQQRVNGLPMTGPFAIQFDSQNELYVATMTGLYNTSNLGTDWQQIGGGFDGLLKSFGIDPQDNLYLGLYQYVIPNGSGGVYFSPDHGQSWELRNNGIEDASILKIEFDQQGRAYLFALDTSALSFSTSTVYFSNDQGMNWERIFDASTTLDTAFALPFNDMEVTDEGGIFIGGTLPPFNAGIVYSNDQGVTWNEYMNDSDFSIDHIELGPAGEIYAIGNISHYYISEDNGETWTMHDKNGWPETDEFLADHNGNFLATGNNQGYWYSSDRGETWTDISDGIPSNGYYQIFGSAFDLNNNIFTLTFDGFYTTDVTVGISDPMQLTENGMDVKVFPNPVRDKLQLEITSGQTGSVTLRIYDISGRQLNTSGISLHSNVEKVTVNTSQLADGIYLYSVENGGNVKRGKFIRR